jgi:hypothetical protein
MLKLEETGSPSAIEFFHLLLIDQICNEIFFSADTFTQ